MAAAQESLSLEQHLLEWRKRSALSGPVEAESRLSDTLHSWPLALYA